MIDTVSYDFVKGATVDYAEELIRSAFLVSNSTPAHLFLCQFYVGFQNIKLSEQQKALKKMVLIL